MNVNAPFTYLFGPVQSRRLGRSLGVDVIPLKTCSLNCVFCQLGPTPKPVTERGEFVPFEAVCAEIRQWLAGGGQADWITFAGSGEPTLYSRLGELIDFIKTHTDIPVIILSNGTLLHRPDVRAESVRADAFKTSLSAWDEASFQRINRPASGCTFKQLLAGERAFRNEFSGPLWLEVFLMEGINADPVQVQRIAELAESIHPDRIHLNTAVRPPADASVKPVLPAKLETLCDLFTPRAEGVAHIAGTSAARPFTTATLVDLIRRHPATAAQLAATFGAERAAVEAALGRCVETGTLQTEDRGGETWYICR
jgi:wyosine [tRNA(Phe)-imidazoG37] synthetase (radical SAM superfamily)